jgi:O-methyltransferase
MNEIQGMNEILANTVRPYTMAAPERVNLLIENARRTETESVPGDMVECGVCNGGSAAILAHFAATSRFRRTTWLFDSFEGLPPTTPEDTPSVSGHPAEVEIGKCVGSIDTVKHVLGLAGADMDRVRIVKGWFQDTFPTVSIPQIAMLNLDSDWYESEKLCLQTFYKNVSIGGFIYFDDFYYWPGCRRAAEEFFETVERPTFNQVGHSMWLQKGR